jgi:hypothetical protein
MTAVNRHGHVDAELALAEFAAEVHDIMAANGARRKRVEAIVALARDLIENISAIEVVGARVPVSAHRFGPVTIRLSGTGAVSEIDLGENTRVLPQFRSLQE